VVTDSTLRVLVLQPGDSTPAERAFAHTLLGLQELVDGNFEVAFRTRHVACLCNETGRIDGLPFNAFVPDDEGNVWDLYGSIAIVGTTRSDNFRSLTDAELAQWQHRLADAPRTLAEANAWIRAHPAHY